MTNQRPQGYQSFPLVAAAPTFSGGAAVTIGLGALIFGAGIFVRDIRAENTQGALLTVTLTLFIALLGFGLIPDPPPRKSFRYINATVMTKAEFPTADSWVHLASTQRPRIAMTLAWSWAALVTGGIAVYVLLVLTGALPFLSGGSASNGGYLLAVLPLLALATFTGYLAVLLIGRRIRHSGNFGARASGVALGETGVAVNLPGRDIEIPWAQIRSVTTQRLTIGEHRSASTLLLTKKRGGENIDLIRLALHPGGAISAREQLLSATGYEVPTDALYSALLWYCANPGNRWELGRVEGQQRLAGWTQYALATRAASDEKDAGG